MGCCSFGTGHSASGAGGVVLFFPFLELKGNKRNKVLLLLSLLLGLWNGGFVVGERNLGVEENDSGRGEAGVVGDM